MVTFGDDTLPSSRRARKSVGAHTDMRKGLDKENATVDITSELAASRKKSRSKSMGPGGLDTLKPGTGNRRVSLAAPRSILKPRISALPEIPPLKAESRHSIENEDTARRRSPRNPSRSDSTLSKIALRTEEEQQAAARKREEQERRDARRKSLASRRVSFAAEATLHTFHEIEFNQDSTISTDSTGRASSVAGQNLTQTQTPDPRRGSIANSNNQYNQDDDSLTSIIYSSDSEPADGVEEVEEDEEEEMSNSDSDDGTMMTIDTEEITGTTMGSEQSVDSEDESSTLDEALRLAAERAGTQGFDYDEQPESDGEDEEVIPSFGWIKKENQPQTAGQENSDTSRNQRELYDNNDDEGTEMGMDMDITQSMGGIIGSGDPTASGDGDMSMDVTRALGGILPQSSYQKQAQSKESNNTNVQDDATMEFTTGIGGIHHSPDNTFDDCANNEDMSMEFTTVMGGVIGQQKRQSVSAARRQTLNRVSDADSTMDMTMSVGRILSNQSENGEIDEDEATLGMDITAAFGGILSSEPQGRRSLGKKIMMEEANKPNSPDKAIFAAVSKPSPKRRSSQASATDTPNATSADLLPFRGKPSDENTPRAKTKTPSPRKLLTPQQSVEQPGRITRQSQSRSPHGTSIRRRSPRKSTMSPAKSPVSNTRSSEKQQSSPRKGLSNPSTPQSRRLSGIGADEPGLGSPRIVEVFDRRSSIGDSAPKFVPGNCLVSFDDPKAMSNEVDYERQNEGEKESTLNFREARFDLPREDEEATLNLRGMIDRMSPQRKPLQGRKSLHVGSAKGLLGKRPAELDENEDEWEENDGVKRLRGRQSSPVKNIKLQQPYDTYSKPIQPPQINLNPSFSSPLNSGQAMTPKERRLKNMKTNHTVHDVNFDRTSQGTNRDGREEESIHLQDFLNMISIRFMELVTTKRRHTTAPTTGPDGAVVVGEDDMSLERCVVASACTVPMLELYQHSCRELKKYIAEGRRMVKEIEADTLEDNPPLFQEYLSATPDVKALMDNQFKNVKTHARLLSKAMWYEWRMKLQEGLKEGVIKISHDMDNDYSVLQEQLDILDTVVPDLLTKYAELEAESGTLEEAAQEIADCDPADLQAARDELVELGEDIDAKKELLESLRKEFKAAEDEVDALATKKSTYLANIEQSEKIRESCRGWSSSEINQVKGRVDALENVHGWAVTGVVGSSTLSMTYRREIELVFDVSSFQPGARNSQIDLWYIADSRESNPIPRTAEKEFFLQCIRDYVRALDHSRTKPSELLKSVQEAWDKAGIVSSQIKRISATFPINVARTSDSSIEMTTSILVVSLQTKVEVTFECHHRDVMKGLDVEVVPQAAVIYGENFNVGKIGEFLTSRIGRQVGDKEENWSDILVELHGRLVARGRKP